MNRNLVQFDIYGVCEVQDPSLLLTIVGGTNVLCGANEVCSPSISVHPIDDATILGMDFSGNTGCLDAYCPSPGRNTVCVNGACNVGPAPLDVGVNGICGAELGV